MERADAIMDKRDWPYLLALTLMGLVLFFWQLGTPGLMDPDEGRYAEIGREILVLKDWVIPHLNRLPYLEKPPVVYWLTALSFKVLGFTELAARLPSAASALGGLFLAYALGRAMWGRPAGFICATVLATCGGYLVLGRLLTIDMTFSLMLNAAIALGYLALSRARPRLWPWAYGVLGLAVLAKGPVALVLAGLIWGLWLIIAPPPQPSPLKGEGQKAGFFTRLRPLYKPWSWLLLAVLTLPWFVAVQWRYPQFFHYFIWEQHFGRFLTPAIHPEPLYYYLPVLLGLLLPWSWLLPWALWPQGRDRDPDWTFLLLWAGVVLVFFSLSRGKLAPYILPALLPLALLLGRRLSGLAEAARDRAIDPVLQISLWVWTLAGLSLTGLLLWPPSALAQALTRAHLGLPYLLVAAAVFTLTPLISLVRRRLNLLVLGVGALILSALLPLGLDRLSLQRSPREMGLRVKSLWQPGAALVGVHLYSQGLSFYSGRVFHLVASRTELDFGRKLAPEQDLFFAELSDLVKFARTRPKVFLYANERDLMSLKPQLPGKINILFRQGAAVLVAYEAK